MTESPTKFIAANGTGGCVLIPRDSTHREVTKVFTNPMHARIECAANLKLLAGVGETLYRDRYVAMLDDMYTIMSYGEFKTTYEDTCFEFFEEGLQNLQWYTHFALSEWTWTFTAFWWNRGLGCAC